MDQALEQIVMVTLVIYRSWEIVFNHQCFFVLKVCLGYIRKFLKKKVSNHQLSWWYGGEPLKAV